MPTVYRVGALAMALAAGRCGSLDGGQGMRRCVFLWQSDDKATTPHGGRGVEVFVAECFVIGRNRGGEKGSELGQHHTQSCSRRAE